MAGTNRRTEFTTFYDAAYSTIVAELLALTGDPDIARGAGAAAFSRAWQAWPSIRSLTEPEMWVRKDAMLRAYRPPRGMGVLQRGLPPVEPVELDPEDGVLVAALQQLPMAQRLPLVLNYLAQVPVPVIAGWAGRPVGEVEALIDDGYEALVDLLDWSSHGDGESRPTPEEAYDWTAESLGDSADRLPKHVTTPPPAIVFRQAAVTTWTKRGAPLTVAATACLGLIVAITTPSEPAARPAAYSSPPSAVVLGALPDGSGTDPLGSALTGPLPAAAPGAAPLPVARPAAVIAPLPPAAAPVAGALPAAPPAAAPPAAAPPAAALPTTTTAPVATAAALPAAPAGSSATSTPPGATTTSPRTPRSSPSRTPTTKPPTTTSSTPTSSPTETTEPTQPAEPIDPSTALPTSETTATSPPPVDLDPTIVDQNGRLLP